MSTPAPKRRRLNGNNSALNKPFKSPFRTPLTHTPNPPATPPSSDNIEPPLDKPEESKSFQQAVPSNPRPSTPIARTLPRPPQTQSRSTVTYTPSLNSQLSQLRATVHTLTQAIQLLEHPESDEALEDLSHKWRTASRAAAEELFATSRDRVNRMGGVGAWRDREKDQKKRVLEWEEEALDQEDLGNTDDDDEDEEDEDDEDSGQLKLSSEEKEMRKEAMKEARKALREQREHKREQIRERKRMEERAVVPGNDDDPFTIDMMLQALNVDLDLIGYSKALQQWVG